MVNNYSKMRRTNQKVREYLLKNNYKNLHFFPHNRFIKDLEIDNVYFDGICTKGKQLVLFQCKTNSKIPKKMLENYKKLEKKYGIRCLYFNWIDRKGLEKC